MAGVEERMPPLSDYVTVRLSRGDARGLVTHIERTFQESDKPMRLAWIAEEVAALLGEPRPYPKMPAPLTPIPWPESARR